jgi:hypothetical protein
MSFWAPARPDRSIMRAKNQGKHKMVMAQRTAHLTLRAWLECRASDPPIRPDGTTPPALRRPTP